MQNKAAVPIFFDRFVPRPKTKFKSKASSWQYYYCEMLIAPDTTAPVSLKALKQTSVPTPALTTPNPHRHKQRGKCAKRRDLGLVVEHRVGVVGEDLRPAFPDGRPEPTAATAGPGQLRLLWAGRGGERGGEHEAKIRGRVEARIENPGETKREGHIWSVGLNGEIRIFEPQNKKWGSSLPLFILDIPEDFACLSTTRPAQIKQPISSRLSRQN